MVRRKREELSESKKQIIAGLLDEYDIKSAEDAYSGEVEH